MARLGDDERGCRRRHTGEAMMLGHPVTVVAARLDMGGDRADAADGIGRLLAFDDIDEIQERELGHGPKMVLSMAWCNQCLPSGGHVTRQTHSLIPLA